jgi:hypothetical protein
MSDYFVQAALDIPPSFGGGGTLANGKSYGDKPTAPTLEEQIENDFEARLNQLNERHAIYKSRLQDRVSNARAVKNRFEEAMQSRMARFNLAHLMYERKCRLQRTVACRRLQELLFECLGEIEKACRRSRLLAESLCTAVTSQKSQATSSTLWREFLLRAEEDVKRRMSLVNMERRTGFKEIYDNCAAECREALLASQYIPEDATVRVRRLVFVKPGEMLPQVRRRNRESRRRVSRLHQSKEEMTALMAALNFEYASVRSSPSSSKSKKANNGGEEKDGDESEPQGATSGRGGGRAHTRLRHTTVPNDSDGTIKRLPLYPAVVQLSTSTVRWLLPQRGCAVNTIVYFCLEERAMLMSKMSAGARGLLSPGVVSKAGNRSLAAYARVQCTMCNILQAIYKDQGGSGGGVVKSVSDLNAALDDCIVTKTSDAHRRPEAISQASEGEEGSMLMYEEKVMLQQFLAASPDVVQATGGRGGRETVLHFAPASVLHIFETALFAALQKSGQLSSADQKSLLEAYPNKTVLRGAGLQLYHLNKGRRSSPGFVRDYRNQNSAPVDGAEVAILPEVAVRELCSLYAVVGLQEEGCSAPTTSSSSNILASQLPDSISIFRSEIGASHGDADDDAGGDAGGVASGTGKRVPLHYFVLHNPTTKSAGKFLSKWNEGRRKSKLKGKKDCYGGLVEKERVAAVEYGRNVRDKRRGSGRRDSDADKDDKDGKARSAESTVPTVALLVGVELPHRSEDSTEIVEQTDHLGRKSSDSVLPVSGLSVGGFCRWRGCLCKGTKVRSRCCLFVCLFECWYVCFSPCLLV